MASVYKVEMKIVSEFVNYPKDELEKIISSIILQYTDKGTKLKLKLSKIKIDQIA